MTKQTNRPSKKPAARPSAPHGEESIKDTFEAIIIAFVLAFAFRAYVVEAFVIPTGSMAPTLLGTHVPVTCQQCGYTFTADPPSNGFTPPRLVGNIESGVCPMCHFPNAVPKGLRTSAGDRILVHKYIYTVSEPRRWDVVVFKAPQKPDINFIKRLVGLPNESLLIIDGNLYVKSNDASAPPQKRQWHIARKTDPAENPHAYDIQQAVWQPIYHSDYIPQDEGQMLGGRHAPWQVPWQGDDTWQIAHRRSYRHNSAEPGEIRFDCKSQLLVNDDGRIQYVYNQWKRRPRLEPVEDLRIAATFVPQQAGLSVQLQTTSRMDDPQGRLIQVRVTIDEQGQVVLETENPNTGAWVVLEPDEVQNVGPFPPGRPRSVALWHVDQEISLWVDERRVLLKRYDLANINVALRRPALRPDKDFPDVRIAVSGSPVTLHHVEVDRDLYYSSSRPGLSARGGVVKLSRGGTRQSADELAFTLMGDHFYCMGDNSPSSDDSRYWSPPDPWIKAFKFDDPRLANEGVVPRRLMMGRAFFVYWPAPLAALPGHNGRFVPNFGNMRAIH